MNKNQQKLLLIGGALVIAILIVVLVRNSGSSNTPPPADNGYYTGPVVNKVGDLVDQKTGKILQKDYAKLPPPNRMKIE